MPFTLPQGVTLTWLGHATVLLATPQGKRVLIDPWTTHNPSCPPDQKEVGPVDLLLITHGHDDHIGDAVRVAGLSDCPIVCMGEIAAYLNSKGVGGERMQFINKGGTIALPGLDLTVTMTHAQHSSGINTENGVIYGGEAAGYVVTLADGFAFYFAGDTSYFSDMYEIADMYNPTLALLPIGDRFTMGPREAARAIDALETVEAVLPIHWGTFPLLTGTPDALREELKNMDSDTEVLTLAPGETLRG